MPIFITSRGSSGLAALALGLALAALPGAAPQAHEFKSKSITVAHPWARATPPGATVGAAYMEIKAGEAGDRLIGASAEGLAGRAEIHTHEHDNGVMRMRKLDALDIPAGKSVVFSPSGHHVMLMDLKKPLKQDDLIAVTLQFEKAGRIVLEATVEPIGAKGPHGMDHQPGHDYGAHDAKDHGDHAKDQGHGQHKH